MEYQQNDYAKGYSDAIDFAMALVGNLQDEWEDGTYGFDDDDLDREMIYRFIDITNALYERQKSLGVLQ